LPACLLSPINHFLANKQFTQATAMADAGEHEELLSQFVALTGASSQQVRAFPPMLNRLHHR